MGLDFTEGATPGGIDAILTGRYDAEIDHLQHLFARVSGQVFLRIGYEFDGAWNAGYEDADRFRRVFRHIVDRLRSGPRAANVRFVWQASASPLDDILDGEREDISAWYPGDDYVDWLAFSWFLHPDEAPTTGARPPTARQLAQEVLTLAETSGKPVMVAEAAPQGYDLGRLTRRFTGPLWDGAAGSGERVLSAEEIWSAWLRRCSASCTIIRPSARLPTSTATGTPSPCGARPTKQATGATAVWRRTRNSPAGSRRQ